MKRHKKMTKNNKITKGKIKMKTVFIKNKN